MGNLSHRHSGSLNGPYYLAWLESWCHDLTATLLALMVCCFGVIVACFCSSLFFMGASLPPDFPLWFYFPISKRTHFPRHLLAFSNPCPSLSLGCGPGKQQALMLETKALKKTIFSEKQSGKRRGQAPDCEGMGATPGQGLLLSFLCLLLAENSFF